MKVLHRSLMLTAMVCERGASIEQYKHIKFEDNKITSYNGLVLLEAPSELSIKASFVIHYDRLVMALRALSDEEFKVTENNDFLIFKRGRLTVRVRKIDPGSSFAMVSPATVPKAKRVSAAGLRDALREVAPFISSDASRPWSTTALMKDGYIWATNNLALVRHPFDMPKGWTLMLPGAAVSLLCELDGIDWIASASNQVIVGSKEAVLSFPTGAAQWPDAEQFFAARPKKLPKADPELQVAAKTVERFSDRFVTLTDIIIEGKVATIESEYELSVKSGKGTYNAALFSLVAEHATHIDFSPFPKPIHFTTKNMQGVMIGVTP